MLEIEGRAKEIYSSAQRKTQMLAEGEFHYFPRGSYGAVGIVNVQSLYVRPDTQEITVPQAEVHIKYSPYNGKEVEYIIQPDDFSKIARKEEPISGILGKIFKPRLEANQSDIEFIGEILTRSNPTGDFDKALSEGKQQLEESERYTRHFNKEIQRAIARREKEIEDKRKEAEEEDRAKRIASQILEEIAQDDECLGIVVDDYRPKYDGKDGVLDGYAKADINCKIHFCLLNESGKAVRVISYIQEHLKNSGNKLPVIIFMDGTMPKCEYTSGVETILALKNRLDKKGLSMPYLVGNSNDRWRNDVLRDSNTEHYLTSLDYTSASWLKIVDAIKEK